LRVVSTASLSRRRAWESFLPQISVVTAPSNFAPPSCSKILLIGTADHRAVPFPPGSRGRRCRSWSTIQEPTTEHWWADVLADPRARIWRQPRGFSGRDGRRTAQKSCYRLAHEPSPVIEVACSKCEWKAGFSRAELLAMYGVECPLPTLLNHLAMPGCSKINTHWDRCGVYYVNPIDGREQ
jgi:hypothetical protein